MTDMKNIELEPGTLFMYGNTDIGSVRLATVEYYDELCPSDCYFNKKNEDGVFVCTTCGMKLLCHYGRTDGKKVYFRKL